MAATVRALRDAMSEVHQAARNQDLVEVPRQAMLDREAERAKAKQPLAFTEPISVPETK